MSKGISDTILVSVDFSHGQDVGVLIVGRKKPNQVVEIINAFQGKEAEAMYWNLVTPRAKKDTNKEV